MSATTEKVEFKCPSGYGNGNFADPATCRRFYQVSFFRLRLLFALVVKCVCAHFHLCEFTKRTFFPQFSKWKGEGHSDKPKSHFTLWLAIVLFFSDSVCKLKLAIVLFVAEWKNGTLRNKSPAVWMHKKCVFFLWALLFCVQKTLKKCHHHFNFQS